MSGSLKLELILGGARSGKSRYAEQQACASGKQVIYIATATAGDEEMKNRIDRHQHNRPANWITVEEPIFLADTLIRQADSKRCLLVDCLTLWLSNILFDADNSINESLFRQQRQNLLDCLPTLSGAILLVSNEVGMGVVPSNPLARRFIDEAGWLHQALAEQCDRVVWVVAGLPQTMKGGIDGLVARADRGTL